MFRRLDPFGNPNVGVYVRATSTHLFVPQGLTPENITVLEEATGHKAVELHLGGSTLLGSLMAANANGAVVADLTTDAEIEVLRGVGLKVARMRRSRLNAAGNNILCNDEGAIVHPDLAKDLVKIIGDTLGVEVERADIAGIPTVGTAAVATNRGVLCHPLTSDVERSFIKQHLHVPARIGTVNHGHGLVGAGMVATQHGVAVGSRTTGIELGRIEEALLE